MTRLFECICCFETYDMDKVGYFILTSVNLQPMCSFIVCEACGRKIIKVKMAKMKEAKEAKP